MPMTDDVIRPVRWWKTRPAFGVPEGSKLRALPDTIRRHGPLFVAELEAIAADRDEPSEARYVALGYLVALHNQRCVDGERVIGVLERVAREAIEPSQWFTRRNALEALVRLREDGAIDRRALACAIALARDPAFRRGWRDALSVLAATGEPAALPALAGWIDELAGADDGADAGDELHEMWSAAWRDPARLLVQLFATSALGRDAIDAAAIVAPLRRPGAVARRLRQVENFFIEVALDLAHDPRMTGVLAALIVACEAGDAERADQRVAIYARDLRIAPHRLEPLRAQLGGGAPSPQTRRSARGIVAAPAPRAL